MLLLLFIHYTLIPVRGDDGSSIDDDDDSSGSGYLGPEG